MIAIKFQSHRCQKLTDSEQCFSHNDLTQKPLSLIFDFLLFDINDDDGNLQKAALITALKVILK